MPKRLDQNLNLAHAGHNAWRICRLLQNRGEGVDEAYFQVFEIGAEIYTLLEEFHRYGDDAYCWSKEQAWQNHESEGDSIEKLRQDVAFLGHLLVANLETLDLRDDRLGQCIRNLFECLAMPEEGATLSLRAGESPTSLQRPPAPPPTP